MKNLCYVLAIVAIALPAMPMTAAGGEQTPAWTARLSPDGGHIELAFRGRLWLAGLRVSIIEGKKTYNSDDAESKLTLNPATRPEETIVKVEGPRTYEILQRSENSSLEISLRGLAPGAEASVALVEADILAGPEPLQARLDGVEDDVQQMVSGRAASGLNDSVYDRFRDQALKVMARHTRFTPTPAGFRVAAGGPVSSAPVCRFKLVDQVYTKRLPFYTPLDKEKWPRAPVGWCSWYFYYSHVREDDILRNVEAMARDYKPFGFEYCLVDAGWQVAGDGENLAPIGGNWREANEKFPHGMKWLADQIRARGIKPALWLAVFGNADEKFYNTHKDWFLHDENGNAKLGTWFGTYVADFSHPELKKYLYDLYRRHTLEWGYDYFKLDGENDTRDIWAQHRMRAYDPALDADAAFRQALSLIREAMSSKPNVFFSACGPSYPTQSIGIAQSARLGADVVSDKEPPSFRGVRVALDAMRRGYYTHNIAWYGDPDALVVRSPLSDDEARTWTSILGLSGQLLMLSDDLAGLPENQREMFRKVMPVADITPMELYPAATDRHVWILHVARAFGTWAVAGIFNWDNDGTEILVGREANIYEVIGNNDRLLGIQRDYGELMTLGSIVERAQAENRRLEGLANKPPGLQLLPLTQYLAPPAPRRFSMRFDKVGLERDREYLLFDFWNQKYLGKVRGEYGTELPPHACQVISLRPSLGHPQLVGTDRHITMGAVELKDEEWDAAKKELHLKVSVVENYPTTLTVFAAGSRFKEANAAGANVKATSEGEIVRAAVSSPKSGDVEVMLQFE